MADELLVNGFLSDAMGEIRESVMHNSKSLFDYSSKLSSFLLSLTVKCVSMPGNNVMSAEDLCNRILLRTFSNFQASIKLSELGFVIEPRTLVRCMIENALILGGLVTAPNETIKMLRDDAEASAQRQSKFAVNNLKIRNKTFLLRLRELSENYGRKNSLKIKEISQKSDIDSLYFIYMSLSNSSVHCSLASLYYFVENHDSKFEYV